MGRLLAILLTVLAVACESWGGQFVPDDPYYHSHEWYGPVLNLPDAWGRSLGSSEVIVAILDTGVIAETPDLAGRLLPPLSATGSPPLDGYSHHHGTWVASVVGMTVNNGMGGAGVGNFSILPITVTDPTGRNTSEWIAAGIRMAAEEGARVINVSHSTLNYGLLDSAAAYARTLGALTFVAAGNSNSRRDITGFENLIFVSGTNASDGRWDSGTSGSSWGPYVDLAAPADDIVVADPTLQPNGYGKIDGTSFAAPLAAGAAALAWSINPHLTADEVLDILYRTAVDLGEPGWDEVFGHGRIDVGAVAWQAPEPGTLSVLAGGILAVGFGRRRTRGRRVRPSGRAIASI